ncbi:hypothetical protein [Paenibacillus antarcticus]|uniref:hypothetical protein n=1 Tax=Paenibacillus antarcticus TaxID=253703 RepID=UPI0012EDC427
MLVEKIIILSPARYLFTFNKRRLLYSIPHDTASPIVTSGIRFGTPAMTARGLGPIEMKEIVQLLKNRYRYRYRYWEVYVRLRLSFLYMKDINSLIVYKFGLLQNLR